MSVVRVPGSKLLPSTTKPATSLPGSTGQSDREPHLAIGKGLRSRGDSFTIPALVTTISGVLTGTWLRRSEYPLQRADGEGATNVGTQNDTALGLFFAGTVLLAVGWSWSLVFPLNKPLWTSSYSSIPPAWRFSRWRFATMSSTSKAGNAGRSHLSSLALTHLPSSFFSGIMARLMGMIRFAGPRERSLAPAVDLRQRLSFSLLTDQCLTGICR